MKLTSSITSTLATLNMNVQEAEDKAKGAYSPLTASELAICTSFLQEIGGSSVPETFTHETPKPADQPVLLSDKARKRFCSILRRVARGQEGLSREEQLFVRQYWQAYLMAQANRTTPTTT